MKKCEDNTDYDAEDVNADGHDTYVSAMLRRRHKIS